MLPPNNVFLISTLLITWHQILVVFLKVSSQHLFEDFEFPCFSNSKTLLLNTLILHAIGLKL